MKTSREVHYLVLGIVVLSFVILCVGSYVRAGGPEILVVTSLATLPTGLIIVSMIYLLRNADKRIQLIWCSLAMILIRSVQIWKVGIDFLDELRFIRYSEVLFQQGQLLGYLRYYPVNLPFASVYYGLYSIFREVEVFEILAFMVYPLLVLGYYFMAKEILKLKNCRENSAQSVSPIMFLPFAPTFTLIPTYYWPQLLGISVLFFSFASLLRLLSCDSCQTKRAITITISLSIVLVFTHSVSSALYLLTILFFYFTYPNKIKRKVLFRMGIVTLIVFIAAHFHQYSYTIRQIILSMLGDVAAWKYIERYSFPDVASIGRQGPIMTLAHTGFFFTVGILIALRAFNITKIRSKISLTSNGLSRKLLCLFQSIKADPLTFSFFGFSILSFTSGFFFGGNFLDPVRLAGWASLLAMPIIIPKRMSKALALGVVLLGLFFLLVWIVNSPWGSPFGSSHNLNKG